MGMRRTIPLLALVLVACGSSSAPPADVSGTYTLNLTNGENECMFPSWTMGATAAGGVTITLTQDSTDTAKVSGTVQGLVGALVTLIYGSADFSGTVTGTMVQMKLEGTRAGSAGNCAYTNIARLTAVASGDNINGTIKHSLQTNMASDCGYRATCENTQTFAGARPPK
jgi:hypothetical protein